mmetsp:Transcript_22855/g.56892  ORF Transcript_22855/g.56892 Transcript_22855/m.56892 type:complete len:102 (+) Transcript_22855:133-438(+)
MGRAREAPAGQATPRAPPTSLSRAVGQHCSANGGHYYADLTGRQHWQWRRWQWFGHIGSGGGASGSTSGGIGANGGAGAGGTLLANGFTTPRQQWRRLQSR